jgi:hypothetical protein
MKINIKDLPLKETKVKLNSYSIIEFTEEFTDNTLLLFEAVSKEQKEKGQREIWKNNHHVINKLKEYFLKKWENPKNLKNKKIEKERLNEWKKYFENYEPSEETINFYKEKMGTKPKFPISSINDKDSNFLAGVEPYRLQTTFNKSFEIKHISDEGRYLNGFNFTEEQIKNTEKNIWKFIIMHEQGHLFEYLKQIIETGTYIPIGTSMFQFSQKDKEDVNKSEVSANAYAIDNMYRKDRRDFLKNSKLEQTEKLSRLKDAYSKGLSDKSKTLDKTLKSIKKENRYFNY